MTTQPPLSDAELDALEAVSEAATPGDWAPGYVTAEWGGLYVGVASLTVDDAPPRCAFLAAANPATVLRLVAELRGLRGGQSPRT